MARYRPFMIKAVREGLGAALPVDGLILLVGAYVMRPVPTADAADADAVAAAAAGAV
jgi:hypothetical protein